MNAHILRCTEATCARLERTQGQPSEPVRHSYLPFGVGRHVCIGAQLALSQATLAIARLARQFTLAMVDERPIVPVATLTTRPNYAPRVRPPPSMSASYASCSAAA